MMKSSPDTISERVRVGDAVVIGLAEHAAGDRQHEEQAVGLLLPSRHPEQELPRHVLADALGAARFLPSGIGA
jgi:hypothetical protein